MYPRQRVDLRFGVRLRLRVRCRSKTPKLSAHGHVAVVLKLILQRASVWTDLASTRLMRDALHWDNG